MAVAVACTLLTLLAAKPTAAEPLLRVRAGTHLELRLSPTDLGADVVAVLRDDMDVPLPDRELRVLVDSEPRGAPTASQALRTDAEGSATAGLALPRARYRIRVLYDGDELYDRCEQVQPLDHNLASVRLDLGLPRGHTLHLDESSVRIGVIANSAAPLTGLRVHLQDELGRELAAGQLDEDGRFSAEVAPHRLGAEGVGALVARSDADATHAAAMTRVAVLRVLRTELTLRALTQVQPAAVGVSGSLRAAGGPLAQKAIGISLDGQYVSTLLTDTQGNFRHNIPLSTLTAGDARTERLIGARFESDAPWLESSRAQAVRWRSPAPSLPSPFWLSLPAALALLLAWHASRRSIRQRLIGATPAAPVRSRTAKLGRRNASTATGWIAGRVEDAERASPIEHANVRLHGPDGRAVAVETGADGSFVTPELVPGQHELSAAADGFATERIGVQIPGIAPTDGLVVQLHSLRANALRAYRPVALRILQAEDLVLTRTPRDALELVRQRAGASDDLHALTELVERAAYARPQPTAHDISVIEHAAGVALQGLGAQASHSRIPKRER
ncbi:MAG TPA: carboxypeptidase-like regulatory domain-containing protein [Polyangiales bacterium]